MIPGPIEFSIHQPMISGQGDAQNGRKYKLLTAKPDHYFPQGRRWLVAEQEDAAENVYVEGAKGSDGFGGATLTFDLADGSKLSLKGPWKSSADALFKATGFDCRSTHLTRGIIALERECQPWPKPYIFRDVLHLDGEPVLGDYDRIRDMARAFANELQRKVWFAVISKGGGTGSWIDAPLPATPVALPLAAGSAT